MHYIQNPHQLVRYVLLTYASMWRWMPDAMYVKLIFWGTFHRNLTLDNSDKMSFNEKLQWLKLYDRKDLYTRLVDKYEFKKFIRDAFGDEYVIPSLGVWNKFEDIDFSSLPTQFVLQVPW